MGLITLPKNMHSACPAMNLLHRPRPTRQHIRLRNLLLPQLLGRPGLLPLPNPPRAGRKIRAIQIRQILARRGVPILALPRRHTEDIHSINLLQRSSMTLANEEIHNHRARETTSREDVSVAVINCRRNVRREEGYQEVEDPVRCSG